MYSHDLQKGDWVKLHNGWLAQVMRKGNTGIRVCLKVFGWFTDIGDVYVWDIAEKVEVEGGDTDRPWVRKSIEPVYLTGKQEGTRQMVEAAGF